MYQLSGPKKATQRSFTVFDRFETLKDYEVMPLAKEEMIEKCDAKLMPIMERRLPQDVQLKHDIQSWHDECFGKEPLSG